MAKKRANGEGLIRQRNDGTWEGRYSVPGRAFPKSVYGKTQSEVRKKLTSATASLDEGVYFEPNKTTVSKWLDAWLESYTGHLKPYSLRDYRSKIKNHVKPYIGAVRVCDLTPVMIQRLYNSLASDSKLAPKSVRNIHGILHSALETLVDIGERKSNPSSICGKRLPKAGKKEMLVLAADDLQRFMKAIKDSPFENMFLVDLFSGLRQGELLGLRWSCIDFEKGCILIDKQLYMPDKGGTYSLQPLKNSKTRTICVASFVLDVLRKERINQLTAKLKAGEAWNEGDLRGLVFTNETGGYISHKTAYNQFKRFAKQVDIPAVRFHDMRHTYATLSLQNGDDIKTISSNLGHATVAFTLDIYGHVTEQMKNKSAQRMEAYIQGIK